MIRLGFLGPEGTFTQLAAQEYRKEVREKVAYQDIKSLFDAVLTGQIDEAVVPIENSLEGPVTLTLDLLVELDLKIVHEIIIPIRHGLLARKEVRLEDVRHVISHRQALAQCRNFLEENLNNYQTYLANSTAKAVEKITHLDKSWAAIANPQLAEKYGLNILKDKIQNNEKNWTRFVVLGRSTVAKSKENKSSIICSPRQNQAGALYDILHEFAIRRIDLTRIESRPAKNILGEYIFFIDFIGYYEDEQIKEALNLVKYKTAWYKLLGSYPLASLDMDD